MLKLDDNFLNEVGLGSMPQDDKGPFLNHIYEELELRVGSKLSEGMSESKLFEFEKILDKDMNLIDRWLELHANDYKNDDLFKALKKKTKLKADSKKLKAEYVASKWLEVNRPDYKEVVAKSLDEIKKEIIQNRDAIING